MNIMKHLMRYEGYTSKERADDILDKISKYGITAVTVLEKEFLDSYSSGTEEEKHNKIAEKEIESIFEDDDGLFKFELEKIEDKGKEIHYMGTLYVPDLEFPSGKKLEGRLVGKIVVYKNGKGSPEFSKLIKLRNGQILYDVFEFCDGLEYELDSFIDYVISELYSKN